MQKQKQNQKNIININYMATLQTKILIKNIFFINN